MNNLEKLLRDELTVMVTMLPLHASNMVGAHSRYLINKTGETLGEYLQAGTEYRVANNLIEIINRILAEAEKSS